MKGIYIFTNKIDKKQYVGQSIHIEERYNQHKRNHLNPNDKEYNTSFYKALRKYGFKNFDYEILTENDDYTTQDLNNLEIFYIAHFNSYYEGYNETKGGQTSEHFTKLKNEEVEEIKKLILNSNISFTEIGNQYNVSTALISMINKGKVWEDNKLTYPLRDGNLGKAKGERVNTSLSSDKEILEIRKQFVNKSLNELYEEYKEKYSFSGLKKIVYGVNHKHLPIYKKKERQWILNGTCIDYPE